MRIHPGDAEGRKATYAVALAVVAFVIVIALGPFGIIGGIAIGAGATWLAS